MLSKLESLNSSLMEQEKASVFQTPLPQMRSVNRATYDAIDSRLQKLFGSKPE